MMGVKIKNNSGFTLVEAVIGAAIFVVLALGVYQAFSTAMSVVSLSRVKITATALANEQFEIMRNLPYADVGIAGGLPSGKIPATQTLTRDNKEFTVETTIRNIDDPFDGTIGGTPNDTSPADYKLAELEITCANCRNFPPLTLATNIAPKNLESASTNGAIFVKVFDSAGLPLTEVDVHMENNQVIPTFSLDDTTNNDGLLQIVDAPPGDQAYEILVSKTGYTTEQTYAVGDPQNPTPDKPHATVLTQQLTEISFIIDPEATINVSSLSNTCEAVPNIDFSVKGTKLIGTSPNVYKYDITSQTSSAGTKSLAGLDSDTYSVTFTDSDYILAGIIPSANLTLGPGETTDLKLIVSPQASSSLLVGVTDLATGLPLTGAEIQLTGTDYASSTVTVSASDCQPAGQAFFTGLNPGNYNLVVTKTGYQTVTEILAISGPWQTKEIILNQ